MTPAAPATEYTIEQIAEIDNRIRKERKAEREQLLDKKNITIIRKGCLHPGLLCRSLSHVARVDIHPMQPRSSGHAGTIGTVKT